MLSSLELNRCLICDAFYGKGIVKRNYLKREDFPHCTVCSLAVWLTMLQNVTSSVSLGSPVWLFHCGINGRTELISCTDCWASHLSIEIHIFCKDWDLWGYFLNGNLPYIFISLDIYKDIWKEAVQRMGGCNYVHRHCLGSEEEKPLGYVAVSVSCHRVTVFSKENRSY